MVGAGPQLIGASWWRAAATAPASSLARRCSQIRMQIFHGGLPQKANHIWCDASSRRRPSPFAGSSEKVFIRKLRSALRGGLAAGPPNRERERFRRARLAGSEAVPSSLLISLLA